MLQHKFLRRAIQTIRDIPIQQLYFEEEQIKLANNNSALRIADYVLGKSTMMFDKQLPTDNHITKKISLYNIISKLPFLHNKLMVKAFTAMFGRSKEEQFPESLSSQTGRILLYHSANEMALKEYGTNYGPLLLIGFLVASQVSFMIPFFGVAAAHEMIKSVIRGSYIEKMELDIANKALIVTRPTSYFRLKEEVHPISTVTHATQLTNFYCK